MIPIGMAHRLQRLRQDHAVERLVVEAGEPALEIALDYVDTIADRSQNAGIVDLDAVADHPARFAQVGKQAAVAAAEVEHARGRRDPARDSRKIGTRASSSAVRAR